MPNSAETIENLARKLERVRILNDLRECRTLEDYQELTKKYELLCKNDKELENTFRGKAEVLDFPRKVFLKLF